MYTLADYFRDENKTVMNPVSMFLCELAEGRIFVFRHDGRYYYTFMQRNFGEFFVYFFEVRKTTREEFKLKNSKYIDSEKTDNTSFRLKLTEDFYSEKIFGEAPAEILPKMEICDIYD